MARVCLFCESTERLTNEHVFPQWLLSEMAANGFSAVPGRNVMEFETENGFDAGALPASGEQTIGANGVVTARNVCASCNSGWLSRDLEKPFSETFRALMREDFAAITVPDVKSLMARWAIKTHMFLDQSSGTQKIYTQTDRAALMQGRFPGNTDVRMAFRPREDIGTGSEFFGISPSRTADGSPSHAWATFIHAGPISFLIRRADNGNDFLSFVGRTQHFAKHCIPILSIDGYLESPRFITSEDISRFIAAPFMDR